MADQLFFALKLGTALGCSLMAGLFFAFSVAVMRGLARLPAAEGIAAMNAINIAIVNPLFLLVFLGTAAGCILVSILSVLRWSNPGSAYLLFGCAAYLIGSILVTAVFNIPRNNALAQVAATDPNAAALWADYLSTWTMWNHVRSVATLVATALLIMGLR
jgi:uncharacterized membrane protein